MRRRVPRRLALALLVALAACVGPSAVDKLEVGIAIHPDTVNAGDTVDILVDVRNLSDDDVALLFDNDCQLLYRVVAGGGMQVAPPGPWFCTAGQTSIVLAPGEVKDTVYKWVAQVAPGA